jgi:hypothetical protein
MHRAISAVARSLPSGASLEGSVIMIVNAPDYLMTPFVLLYRSLFNLPGPAFAHVLGVSRDSVTVKRLDEVTLELTPAHGYLSDATSILVRSRAESFKQGQVVNLFGARVRIAAITDDGRPARVKVETFGVDDPRLLWVSWDDQQKGYVRMAMPRPGESLSLPAF